MSDDDYGDDEYADFHDMLYDADPDPDLADDLAEHAAYSPVWFDNPHEETRDYFSDWDYYSDDYFDDDPALLSNLKRQDRDQNSLPRKSRQIPKRGRKRKLSEAQEHSSSDTKEVQALKACIQGTVWKSGSPEPFTSYQAGITKPVALRLSKAIMRSAYSRRHGFGKGALVREESWANDLSLADMGLRTETSVDMQQDSVLQDDNEGMDEDDDHFTDDSEQERESDKEFTGRTHVNSVTKNLGGNESSQTGQPDTLLNPPSNKMQLGDTNGDGDTNGQSYRKRRKIVRSGSSFDSKNNTDTPETSLDSMTSDLGTETTPDRNKGAIRKQRGREQHDTDKISDKIQSHGTMHSKQKRKLSDTEQPSTIAGNGRAAKRANMSKNSSNTEIAQGTRVSRSTGGSRKQ